jgi:NAD(P)H dehydrogenase (quinone)
MTVKVQVVFYSMYGHIYRMAEAVAEGARELEGAEVALYQVPELVPEEVLERSGAKAARSVFAHVPIIQPAQLAEADAIIFGAPTRFGNMCAQMRNFLDQTGGLWAKGALIGKVGSVFTATATQHGGQETTLTSFHTTLLHHGMIIVGTPYSEARLTIMRRSRAALPTVRPPSPAATESASLRRTSWPSPASRAATLPGSPTASSPGSRIRLQPCPHRNQRR